MVSHRPEDTVHCQQRSHGVTSSWGHTIHCQQRSHGVTLSWGHSPLFTTVSWFQIDLRKHTSDCKRFLGVVRTYSRLSTTISSWRHTVDCQQASRGMESSHVNTMDCEHQHPGKMLSWGHTVMANSFLENECLDFSKTKPSENSLLLLLGQWMASPARGKQRQKRLSLITHSLTSRIH